MNRITNRSASILFIGENDVSKGMSIQFSANGYQTAFYSDSHLISVNELIKMGIHVTDLIYDILDVDIIILSKPSAIELNPEADGYLSKMVELIKLIFHEGLLILWDNSFRENSSISIPKSIEMAAYIDPSAPLVDSMTEGSDYFICEYDITKAGNLAEMLVGSDKESLDLGVELIKGAIRK